MLRKSIAAVWLGLLAANWVSPLLALPEKHECRCDERLCRCMHEHGKTTVPDCHLPDGTPLPALKTCQTQDDEVPLADLYVLPEPAVLEESLRQTSLEPVIDFRIPFPFEEISPPPPRLLPA